MDRHARQTRLVGVGAAGQQRIGRARVDVPLDGFAAGVAARYLAGAGVACLRVREASVGDEARGIDAAVRVEVDPTLEAEAGPERGAFRDSSAAELGRGALAALRALRDALGPA